MNIRSYNNSIIFLVFFQKKVRIIAIEKPSSYYDEDNVVRNLECYWGRFTRNIILPENLDFELIKAVMENNLLKITIPKLHVSAQNIKINRIGENF